MNQGIQTAILGSVTLWFCLTGIASKAQMLTHFSTGNGKLLSDRVAEIWPTPQGRLWLRQDMPMPAAYLENDSVTYLSQLQTGFNPANNPLVGAFATNTGTTWLALNRLPGWIEGPLGNSNGGLVRFQNNLFTTFNSLNFPPLSSLKEKLWYCGVMSPDFSRFWVGGDSGIRSIDLGTFQVRRFFNDTLTTLTQAYWRGAKASKSGVWFMRDNYRWAYQIGDTMALLEKSRFGLADSLVLMDVGFVKTDTLFLTLSKSGSQLWKRNGTTTQQALPQPNLHLRFLAIERDSLVWILGDSGLYYGTSGFQKEETFDPSGKELACFRIDGAGNKWIGTLNSGLYRISNLKATIVWEGGNPQNYCYTKAVKFKSQVETKGGSQFQYLWQFGDGRSSTEAEPEHVYGWTGRFRIRLTIRDQFGAMVGTVDTLQLNYRPDVWMNPNRDSLFICSAETLATSLGGQRVNWFSPDGTQQLDSVLVVSSPGLYYFKSQQPGCRGSDSIFVALRPAREGKMVLEYGPGDTILAGDTLRTRLPVTVRLREEFAYCSPFWTVNDSLIGNDLRQTLVINRGGSYSINLISSSLENCQSEANRTVFVKEIQTPQPPPPPPPLPDLVPPTLVTANGDGKNDFFALEALQFYPQNELAIFNRWGKEVFSASPYANNWPREDVEGGVYFYRLKAGEKTFSGWVLVKR
jgi:gliding motility-associated-like protein